MSMRGHAARLLSPALVALVLVAVLSSRSGSPDVASRDFGDWAGVIGAPLLHEEGLLIETARISVGELSQGIQRSRSLFASGAVVLLGMLVSVALLWRIALTLRGSRKPSSPPRRVARARAPPLQLA
jgi:hypothetical protein